MIIGLTTYAEPATMLVWQREFAMLHATYVAATERAGGIAVLLPPPGSAARIRRPRIRRQRTCGRRRCLTGLTGSS